MKTKLNLLLFLILAVILTSPSLKQPIICSQSNTPVLSEHVLSLDKREPDPYINEGFSDNMLLALHYFKGDVNSLKIDKNKPAEGNIDWNKVRNEFEFNITLEPGEVFVFHDNILPEYSGSKLVRSNTRYYYDEGYKSVAGLVGNGVCHLASLMTWTAKDAKIQGLEVEAPVNHDFYPVKGVPRQFGTAIFYAPSGAGSQAQNLYIKNRTSKPIVLGFKADAKKIDFKVLAQEDSSRLAKAK